MRDTKGGGGQRHRQREKQAPYQEADVGLDPRILGSLPEPKADAQPLNHPGAPKFPFFILFIYLFVCLKKNPNKLLSLHFIGLSPRSLLIYKFTVSFLLQFIHWGNWSFLLLDFLCPGHW